MSLVKLNKGNLLIAEPSLLHDNSFNKSLILLTEYNKNNSIGFILNKPLKYLIKDIIPDIDCSFTVYQGGPVEQNNLYFIHKIPELLPNSIQIKDKLHWGGDFEALKKLLIEDKIKETQIRFFLGYSGWGSSQLDEELENKSWFVSENNFENIFTEDNNSLWRNKLIEKGGEYVIWANAPNDINLN